MAEHRVELRDQILIDRSWRMAIVLTAGGREILQSVCVGWLSSTEAESANILKRWFYIAVPELNSVKALSVLRMANRFLVLFILNKLQNSGWNTNMLCKCSGRCRVLLLVSAQPVQEKFSMLDPWWNWPSNWNCSFTFCNFWDIQEVHWQCTNPSCGSQSRITWLRKETSSLLLW
jgi:hypothetical protein